MEAFLTGMLSAAVWASVVVLMYWVVALVWAKVLVRRYAVEAKNTAPLAFWFGALVFALAMVGLGLYIASGKFGAEWPVWWSALVLLGSALVTFWSVFLTLLSSANDIREAKRVRNTRPIYTGDPTL